MLPLSVLTSNIINFLPSLPALFFFLLVFRPGIVISAFDPRCPYVFLNSHVLWFPLLIVTQALFLTGLGFLFSALNVFFRDTSVLVEVGLSAWFFLTPIIYDAKAVAGQYANLMYYFNPMASIISNYRDIFYYSSTLGPEPRFMFRTLIECF